MLRIIDIIRDEMDKIGQEFLLPTLHPRELWESSGRWAVMGDNMFRLKDRGGRDPCLGMPPEEVITENSSKKLPSFKELPQIFHHMQNKCPHDAPANDVPTPRTQ